MTREFKFGFFIFVSLSLVNRASSISPDLNCSGIYVVDRSGWNSKVSPVNDAVIERPWRVVIHHTSTEECKNFHQCKDRVLQLQKHDVELMELNDIATNFLIGGDGRVYEGRGWDVKGAHTRGYPEAIGITFIGNYDDKLPTNPMLNAAFNLIACGVRKKKLEYKYSIHGHRDLSCSSCPGQELYDSLRSWPNYDVFHVSKPDDCGTNSV